MQKILGQNIYYGWYIAISLAITETVSYGVLYYALQVFITSIEADLGWTRSQISLGGSLSILMLAFMAYPVGWWVDKHGARLLMTVGSIGAAIMVIAWSQVTSLWVFYAIWFGIGIFGSMILYEPAFAVIAVWFNRRRGTALTVVTLAAGFASTIFQPLSNYLLQNFGWRGAVFILGSIFAVITIPLNALILRRHPSDLGLVTDGGHRKKVKETPDHSFSLSEAINSRFFWLLTLSFMVAGFATHALRFHFIPYLEDIGVTASTAAFASGSIGFMQVVGRLIFVPLDSHMSGRIMVAGLFFLQAIAIIVLLMSGTFWTVIIFVAFFGASVGMRTLVRPSILADTFGSANYGRISSVMALPLTLSATVAPVLAGFMFDFFGNYDWLILLTLILSIIAGGIILLSPSVQSVKTKRPTE